MLNKLKDLINLVLEDEGQEIIEVLRKEDSLTADLGFDSLALAVLTVHIEESFGIDVFEDGIVDTVEEIIEKLTGD